MRILIVGGAGFIGAHLSARLATRGDEVTVLDALLPQVHGPKAKFPPALRRVARCVHGDARQPVHLRAALKGQELVYWLAAETGTGQSMYRVRRYVSANVGGLAALCEALLEARACVKRVVLTSSRAVYGEGAYRCTHHGVVVPLPRLGRHPEHGWWPACPTCSGSIRPLPTPESVLPRPSSVYGWTKLAQEQLLQMMGDSLGVECAMLRLQNVYGPGQALRNPYTGVLALFCTRAVSGAPLVVYEDGEIARDFVYVGDVVGALLAAGQEPRAAGQVFNIGTGRPVTIRQAAESMRRLTATSSPIEIGGHFRIGDVRHAVADIDRARIILGWSPELEFEHGLAKLVTWVRAQSRSPDRSASVARELGRRGILKEERP